MSHHNHNRWAERPKNVCNECQPTFVVAEVVETEPKPKANIFSKAMERVNELPAGVKTGGKITAGVVAAAGLLYLVDRFAFKGKLCKKLRGKSADKSEKDLGKKEAEEKE